MPKKKKASKEIELSVPASYQLTDGEIDNIVYLTLKYTIDWPMRQADLAVCKQMAGKGTGPDQIRKLVRETCEYAWDHLAGEPDEFSPQKLYEHIAPVISGWFAKTTQAERTKTD